MLFDALQVYGTKGGLPKKTKEAIYKNGFLVSAGIFAGIAMDNLWHMLNLGGTDKNVIRAGNQGPSIEDKKQDAHYQSLLLTGIVVGSIIANFHTSEIIPAVGGAYLGSNWANQAEQAGHRISVLPF